MKDKYTFSFEGLKGEELLTLGDILDSIVVFSEDDEEFEDKWYREQEEKHEEYFLLYKKQHPDYKSPTFNGNPYEYEKDDAWMYAEIRVLNRSLGRLDDDKIGNYFMCGRELTTDEEEVWNKAVTVKEEEPQLEYLCTDHYDFTWGR